MAHPQASTTRTVWMIALLLLAILVWVICLCLLIAVTSQLLDTLRFIVDLAQMG